MYNLYIDSSLIIKMLELKEREGWYNKYAHPEGVYITIIQDKSADAERKRASKCYNTLLQSWGIHS